MKHWLPVVKGFCTLKAAQDLGSRRVKFMAKSIEVQLTNKIVIYLKYTT